MQIRSTRNLSRTLKPPVQKYFDNKTKQWCIKDKENFVIADCLTKEYADVIESSINLVGPAVALLKILIEQEEIVEYRKESTLQQKSMRKITIDKINEFLCKDIGFEQEPQDSSQNIREWGRSLLNIPRDDGYEYFEEFNDDFEH